MDVCGLVLRSIMMQTDVTLKLGPVAGTSLALKASKALDAVAVKDWTLWMRDTCLVVFKRNEEQKWSPFGWWIASNINPTSTQSYFGSSSTVTALSTRRIFCSPSPKSNERLSVESPTGRWNVPMVPGNIFSSQKECLVIRPSAKFYNMSCCTTKTCHSF